MSRLLLTCLLLGTSSFVAAAEPQEDSIPHATPPFVTLTGTDSHVKERSYHRVVSKDDWIKIWQRHKGAKESNDLPFIDFEKCMVISVFQGSGQNSAGLKKVALLEEKDRIVLRFEDMGYQTMGRSYKSGGGAQQVTVYGFFVLPRSSKNVVLEEYHHCIDDPQLELVQRVSLPK